MTFTFSEDPGGFTDGDVVYYDQSVTGGYTKTFPTTGPIVTVAAVVNGGSSGAGYLASTLFNPVFPDLWAIRSQF